MFTFLSQFCFNPEPDLLLVQRLVFANGTGSGSGSSGGRRPTVGGQNEPEDQQEAVDTDSLEARIRSQHNEEYAHQIHALRERTTISNEAADTALEALGRGNQHAQSVARLLAQERIDENLYDLVNECLESDVSARKALGRQMATGRLNQQPFEDALDDLESGDHYRLSLARRLALGQINAQEFIAAHNGLNSTDVDELRASQQLALSYFSPQQFREAMHLDPRAQQRTEFRAEDHQDPVGSAQKEFHDRIVELLMSTNLVIEQLSEQERTRPVLTLQKSLQTLNNRDSANQRGLMAYLRHLNEDVNLSPENISRIRNFNIENRASIEQLRRELSSYHLGSKAIKNVMRYKLEERDIELRFNERAKAAADIINVAANSIHLSLKEAKMIEEAEEESGITLKEGSKIQYVHPDIEYGNVRTQTITKVRPITEPITEKNGNVIGRRPVNLEIYLDNGEVYSLGKFLKWVNATDAYEVIENKKQAEEKIGLQAMGMALNDGQQIEFTTGYQNRNGVIIPQRDQNRIVSIDDKRVVLEQAVHTFNPDEDPHARLLAPRVAREMNLGEFVKWARRHQMVPNIPTLEDLRNHLREYNDFLNRTENVNGEVYPPITLGPGEILQYGDDHRLPIKIKKADDNGVTFPNGDHLTLPQFLGWVKHNKMRRSNPSDVAARAAEAAKNLGEEAVDDIKKKTKRDLNRRNDKLGKPDPEDPKKKSFWEKISPYLTSDSSATNIGLIDSAFGNYTFISMMDLINMGKELLEFIKRKHARRSKGRYGNIGTSLPAFLGTEFDRVKQAAENEEVNQYKEAMSNWGVWDIMARLHQANSTDEAKACFIVLHEKGELRWDDMNMWRALNKLIAKKPGGSSMQIPITPVPQPHPDDPSRLVSGEDRVKEPIDALWGQGQFAEWFSGNVNNYNSKKSAYEYKGKQLEHDPKGTDGLTGEMTRLLKEWKSGNYVNPQEYEELIDFAIKYGKMNAESKMFFLMEGVSAKCPSGPMEGMTLLHLDRIGDLDGQWLNQFPMLDFFTNKLKKNYHPKYLAGELKDPPEGGYKIDDYKFFIEHYFPEESEKCLAGKNFSKFLWEQMIVDPYFRIRLSKGLRRAENMDHDDAHMFIPPAGIEEIANLTGPFQGHQKFFTPAGYMNGYAGFNQFIVSLSNRYEDLKEQRDGDIEIKGESRVTQKMLDDTLGQVIGALQSYVLFDSYMSGRNEQTNPSRARLDDKHYDDVAVVDLSNPDFTVREHKAQLDNLVTAVAKEYEIPTNLLYKKVAFNEKTKQNEIASFIDNFIKRDLPDKIKAKRDNGAALLDIIHERKILAQTEDKNVNALRGIKKSNRLLKSDDALSEEEVKALVKRKEAEDEVSVFGKSGEN
ncbi:MAG: hypothetical protein UT55_C0002G0007 [Candidatus Peregrinibacteria bacterium GW2011_GWE2_39_6]|nr:MAG: hypothetical protein UT36_C0002G0051 [Candidatus Peregrinibacteria bacterium GW2011_GWF2_39_17]KKR26745.1 MAG: hypothetical protein UT55_C0002G0007 [Candidatus Peregrinibacteria bacterium GW2011_GWE2_39_6]HCW32155.1 hypothetical protein [Candidatus Peregrinibacteria bacterium]